jgi:hypothetical protein
VFDSSDCLLDAGFGKKRFPASTLPVAKKVEFFVMHLFRVWRSRASVWILAVPVVLPCFAESGSVFTGYERLKRNDSGSVPIIVRGSQVVHEGHISNVAMLNGRQVSGERLRACEHLAARMLLAVWHDQHHHRTRSARAHRCTL